MRYFLKFYVMFKGLGSAREVVLLSVIIQFIPVSTARRRRLHQRPWKRSAKSCFAVWRRAPARG
jgi:hypothetical protein